MIHYNSMKTLEFKMRMISYSDLNLWKFGSICRAMQNFWHSLPIFRWFLGSPKYPTFKFLRNKMGSCLVTSWIGESILQSYFLKKISSHIHLICSFQNLFWYLLCTYFAQLYFSHSGIFHHWIWSTTCLKKRCFALLKC